MLNLTSDTEFARRANATYNCPNSHAFTMTFADGIIQPVTWDCPRCGRMAHLAGTKPLPPAAEPGRMHWDMLRERRSLAELAELLDQYTAD